MRHLFLLLLFITFTTQANSQESSEEIILPPTMISVDNGLKPMELTNLDVDVHIHNDIAETEMTMTFYNPGTSVLAGDLYFPLPEGALVNGYALDINGKMVDGSIVKKHKARQVFEKEMRKGIDPGLIEYTKGNNYKTRVFPIPAQGSRTVMIRYISDLNYDERGPNYLLPLNFKNPLKQFNLRIEVIKPESIPTIAKGSLANFSFAKWNDSYVAKTSLENTSLTEDLSIALPTVSKSPVAVEQGADGNYYFYINDFPNNNSTSTSRIIPRVISIIWDASGSRKNADHEREIRILKSYLASFKSSEVSVKLSILRNTISNANSYTIKNGNVKSLINTLRSIKYDGGTQLGAINKNTFHYLTSSTVRKHPNAPHSGPIAREAHLYLLFSDGISNFGEDKVGDLSDPVYIISGDSTSNHPYLHHLAAKTGGRYFNLARVTEKDVVQAIGMSPYSYLRLSEDEGDVYDTYPSTTQVLGNRFALVGKLKSKQAKITLHYGTAGKTQNTVSFTLNQKNAPKGNLLRTYWAQQKINELLIHDPENEEAFVSVGQEYGLVTPGTSLLVLETLEQYVEHQVVPPASLPDIQIAYDNQVRKQQKQKENNHNNKIEQIVNLWNQRIKWWNTDFTANHKKPIFNKLRDTVLPGLAELRTERSTANENVPPPPAPPAPPPPPPPSQPIIILGGGVAEGMRFEEEELLEHGDFESTGDIIDLKKQKVESEKFDGEITLKAWDPDTPYLKKLNEAGNKDRIKVYFEQRAKYESSPAFYLDCAEFFYRENDNVMALQILSNITELELESPALLRVAAHRLQQAGELDLSRLLFEEVLKLRPEEPQSYRDLALVLEQLNEYGKAIDLLYHIVLNDWDRFSEIELIALMELNHILPKAKKADFDIDSRLIKLLDLDVRIVMTWDADMTDIDLWVLEPSGEKAFYSHNRTKIGGLVSRDFTQGYGPEEYLIKETMAGTYKIQANYYGSRSPALTGPITLQLDIYSNYGRADEKHQAITLRLANAKEVIDVGEVKF